MGRAAIDEAAIIRHDRAMKKRLLFGVAMMLFVAGIGVLSVPLSGKRSTIHADALVTQADKDAYQAFFIFGGSMVGSAIIMLAILASL